MSDELKEVIDWAQEKLDDWLETGGEVGEVETFIDVHNFRILLEAAIKGVK